MMQSERTVEALFEEWPNLDEDAKRDAFHELRRDRAADFFLNLSTHDQKRLLLSLPEGEQRLWIRLLAPDDVADLIQEVPSEERPNLLAYLDESTRSEVIGLLVYAEDAAGGLMNPRYSLLRPEMTTEEAIAYLRRQGEQAAAIYYAYVVDSEQRLLGMVTFRHLLSAPRNARVREIMKPDIVSVPDNMDQEALAALFSEYHFLAIPVVDAEGRMKGIVTVDDIVDVVREEASEDFQKIAGVQALDAPYLETRFVHMVRKRGGWLSLLLLGQILTTIVMGYFEEEIARAVILALFIPMIISSGGNTGSQAATLVIRAMALDEVRLRDWLRVMRRELFIGGALGLVLGLIGVFVVVLWQAMIGSSDDIGIVAVAIAGTLVGVVLSGTIIGSMLPFVLRRLGFDPAIASAPFVATLMDITGVTIYFTVASLILRGTLL